MAPMLFAKAISEGKPIKVFNNGQMERDFTYVDDIVNGVIKATLHPVTDGLKYKVLNIGNGSPVNLMERTMPSVRLLNDSRGEATGAGSLIDMLSFFSI